MIPIIKIHRPFLVLILYEEMLSNEYKFQSIAQYIVFFILFFDEEIK